MLKLERDADVEVPTKVTNINVYAMIAPIAGNILPFTIGIINVNGLYID
jgi:hypothetical protein